MFNHEAPLALEAEILDERGLTKIFDPLMAPEEYVYDLISILRKFADGKIFPKLNPVSGRFLKPASWAKAWLLKKVKNEADWKKIEELLTSIPELSPLYNGSLNAFTELVHAFSDTKAGFKLAKGLFVKSLDKQDLEETSRWMKVIAESRVATPAEIDLTHRLFKRTMKRELPPQFGVWQSTKCHTIEMLERLEGSETLATLANAPLVRFDSAQKRLIVWLTHVDGVVRRLEFDPFEYRLVGSQSWQTKSEGTTHRQIATADSMVFEDGSHYQSVHKDDPNSYETQITRSQDKTFVFHHNVVLFTTYQQKIRFILRDRILDYSLQLQPIGTIPLVDFEATRADALEGGEKLVLQSSDYRFAFVGDAGIESTTEHEPEYLTVAYLSASADRSTIATQIGDTYTEFTKAGSHGPKKIEDTLKAKMLRPEAARDPEAFNGFDEVDYYVAPLIRFVPFGKAESCFTTLDTVWLYHCPNVEMNDVNKRLFKMVGNTHADQTYFIPGSHAVTVPYTRVNYYDAWSDISARVDIRTHNYSSGIDATHVEMVESDMGWLTAIWVDRKLLLMTSDFKK